MNDEEKEDWKRFWQTIEKIPFDLASFNKQKLKNFLKSLLNFARYHFLDLNETESKLIIEILLKNTENKNLNRVASIIYSELLNLNIQEIEKSNFYLIYFICYNILDNNFKSLKEKIEDLKYDEIKLLFKNLINFDWIAIEDTSRRIKYANKKLKNLINEVIKNIRDNLIKVQISLKENEITINSIFEIEVNIKNLSKNDFIDFKLSKFITKPKRYLQILNQDSFYIFKLRTNEQIEEIIKFKALKIGEIKFKNLILMCKDKNENPHEFKSNTINIIIRNNKEDD